MPDSERARWGTIRPTNASEPQAATAAPDSRVTAATPTARVVEMFWPRLLATSSPRESAFRPGALTIASTRPTRMNGSTCQTTSEPLAAIEPACQKRKTSIACSSSSTMAEVSAYSRALTAVPASASVTGVGPPLPPTMPSANTPTLAIRAPARPNQM